MKSIEATTERDGSAAITIGGKRQKIIGADLNAAREKVLARVREYAASTNETIRFTSNDPDNVWIMLVDPDGQLREQSAPTQTVSSVEEDLEDTVPSDLYKLFDIESGTQTEISEGTNDTLETTPATQARNRLLNRFRFSRRSVIMGVGTLIIVLGIVSTIFTRSGDSASSIAATPAATHSAKTVTLPGWANTPSWQHQLAGTAATLTAGGEIIAVTSDDRVELIDPDGTVGEVIKTETAADVQAGLAGKTGILAILAGKTLWIATSPTGPAMSQDVPENAVLTTRGTTIYLLTPAGASQVTAAGLTPAPSPFSGAALLGTVDELTWWASARGTIHATTGAGPTGTGIPLTPPSPGATIQKWVALTSQTVWVVWNQEGSLSLVGHSLTTGTPVATGQLTTPSLDGVTWMASQDNTAAIFGQLHISLTDTTVTPLPAPFVATKGIGDQFYGSAGTREATLTGTEITTISKPTVTPKGIAEKNLITYDNGTLTSYPTTSRKTK